VRIAPEGRPFVIAGLAVFAALAALAAAFGGWWWVAASVWFPIAVWVPWFFRDPERNGPRSESVVIAPADGRVVSVTQVEEPTFVRGSATRISIFMSVFDVHVNRYPVGGNVAWRQYEPGSFVNATLDKASDRNERMSLGIEGSFGRVLVRQIAGLVARRIVTDAAVGDAVTQGMRLGLIRFGSRVDTFLPDPVHTVVSVGDRTRAGITPIAEWKP
jgi:phosphatidylserine decarboxylase